MKVLSTNTTVKVTKLINKGTPALETEGLVGRVANLEMYTPDGRDIKVVFGKGKGERIFYYYIDELEVVDKTKEILNKVLNGTPMRVVTWDEGIYLIFKNGLFQNNLGEPFGARCLQSCLLEGEWEEFVPKPKFKLGNIVHKNGDLAVISSIDYSI